MGRIMFERFTDRARKVVVLSQEESRMLWHGYIGTEHLLLGLLAESDGVAGRALAALGVELERTRAVVEARTGMGSCEPKGHIPFTPRTKKVLELSLREALQLGHNYIGTEHVLLALVREGEGVACATINEDFNVKLDDVRRQVLVLLSGKAEPTASVKLEAKLLARCVCTHVAGHHHVVGPRFACAWRGCGCPTFVEAEAQGA